MAEKVSGLPDLTKKAIEILLQRWFALIKTQTSNKIASIPRTKRSPLGNKLGSHNAGTRMSNHIRTG